MGVASEFFNSILSALHLLLQTQNYYTNIIVPLCRDKVTVCCSTAGCEVILGRGRGFTELQQKLWGTIMSHLIKWCYFILMINFQILVSE
jgi:hypothetical protein